MILIIIYKFLSIAENIRPTFTPIQKNKKRPSNKIFSGLFSELKEKSPTSASFSEIIKIHFYSDSKNKEKDKVIKFALSSWKRR